MSRSLAKSNSDANGLNSAESTVIRRRTNREFPADAPIERKPRRRTYKRRRVVRSNTGNRCEVLPQLPADLARRSAVNHAGALHLLQDQFGAVEGSLGAGSSRQVDARRQRQRRSRNPGSRRRVNASSTPSDHECPVARDTFDRGDVAGGANRISDATRGRTYGIEWMARLSGPSYMTAAIIWPSLSLISLIWSALERNEKFRSHDKPADRATASLGQSKIRDGARAAGHAL